MMTRLDATAAGQPHDSTALPDSVRLLIERDSLRAVADRARVDSLMGHGVAVGMPAGPEDVAVMFYTVVGLLLGALVLGAVFIRERRRDRDP